MAITSNDIKIYQAQDNTDNDSGGGSRTASEIVDGDVNNLFADISRIDTVSGDVALRKIFPTVDTLNNDVYYGAHMMIRRQPSDSKVSALIFHSDNPHDTRLAAQDKIESYVTASYKEQFYLYGNHIAGSKSVTFLMPLSANLPSVGEVYLLKQSSTEQYIRIVTVNSQQITLTYSVNGVPTDYQRIRAICEIEQVLDYAFTGSVFIPGGQQPSTCDTYATQLADAAKFYSTKTLSIDAVTNDTTIQVDSIYEQLVPASTKQTPMINRPALAQANVITPTGEILTVGTGVRLVGASAPLGYSVIPGSVTNFGGTNYIDDGKGAIIEKTTSERWASIDYMTGVVTIEKSFGSSVYVTFECGIVVAADVQFTASTKITLENQGLVFVKNITSVPSSRSLYVDYRAKNKWYRMSSNADGTIGNDPAIGAGLIADNGDGTATVSMTLAALPDIDSSVIVSWASLDRLNDRKAFIAAKTQHSLQIELGKTNIDPTTFTMDAYSVTNGSSKRITADANGVLSDTSAMIKGTLDSVGGKLIITQTGFDTRLDAPGSGRNVTINFNYATVDQLDPGAIKQVIASRTPGAGEVPFTAEDQVAATVDFAMGVSPVLSSVRLQFELKWLTSGAQKLQSSETVILESDASGVLRKQGRHYQDTTSYGTVSAAGEVHLQLESMALKEVGSFVNEQGGSATPRYIPKTVNALADEIIVTYMGGAPTAFAQTHQIIDKLENIATYRIQTYGNIVGEVKFRHTYNGTAYELRSKAGIILTSTEVQVGTINYKTGEILLNYWKSPGLWYCAFTRLFTDELGDNNLDSVKIYDFRTGADKLTTSSFQFRYETMNGTYSATSDQNGVITGTDIDAAKSFVDTKTGMAHIEFTVPAIATSFKFDAVAETSLFIDPDLLGLNPIRLPSNGKVPVFDAGRHLVIFNEATTAVPGGTPVADQVVTLARSGQAYIEVVDANGKRLDVGQYTADRQTGTVTFANPLTLNDKYSNALTAPFSVVDRIEDMALATDVQINGLITLSAPLAHSYTKDNTKVASALVWGDTGSRAYNLFAQEIWNNGNPVWSDERIGDPTTAQYDAVNYPIQINNRSSVAGRWAIIFVNSTTVNVVEERMGVVQSNVSIAIDNVAPVNPATGTPYFTMLKGGFGAGWITNNVIRFNTDSGENNAWIIRTVQSGALSQQADSIEIEVRGDAN